MPDVSFALNLNRPGVVSFIGGGGKTSLMFRLAGELAASGSRVLTTTTTNLFFPTPDQSPMTLVSGDETEILARATRHLAEFPHISAGSRRVPEHGKLKGFSAEQVDRMWGSGCFDWILVEADGAKRKPVKASAPHEPVIPFTTSCLIHVTGLDALGTRLDDEHVHRPAIFSANTGLAPGTPLDAAALARSARIEIQKAAAMADHPATVAWLNKADSREQVRAGQEIAGLIRAEQGAGRVVVASLVQADPVKDVIP